ncbi:helicase DnaB [Helicobacter suis]|uniref:helicase DnaB n=1 Tax=Helicobacter suis TaxID=104628 RepID=UPI0013D0A836|nr:helicase DnaB [Helicobacter suis]
MEFSITHSAICFPQFLEEFLDGIGLSYFEPVNAQVLGAVLKLYNQSGIVNLDTLKLWLGEDFMASAEVLRILEAQIVPDYLSLKEDFKRFIMLKRQSWLSVQLAKASRAGEIFNMEVLAPFVSELQTSIKLKTLEDYLLMLDQKPPIPKLATGLEFLDSHLDGGLELGQLVLVGGDPESGKTLLSIQIAEFMLHSVKGCFFCYEFAILKYVKGLKARGIKFLPRHYYLEEDYSGFEEFIYQIKLLIKCGVKVFVIDSQQMIKHRLRGFNEESAESEKFSVLQTMAKRYEVLIILIVQNSKSDKSSPSGSIKGAYLAHVYLQLTRPKKYECKWATEQQRFFIRKLSIHKNKQTGRAGICFFAVDTNKYRIMPCMAEDSPINQLELPPSAFGDEGGGDEN